MFILIIHLSDYTYAQRDSQLIETVRQLPYATILFHGIEKAHSQILNNLSKVLIHNRLLVNLIFISIELFY
jgi:ATP-dependent Clp protease ATP-binding subunit ClpA